MGSLSGLWTLLGLTVERGKYKTYTQNQGHE